MSRLSTLALLSMFSAAWAARIAMVDADSGAEVLLLCASSSTTVVGLQEIPASIAFEVFEIRPPVVVNILGDASLAVRNRTETVAPFAFYGHNNGTFLARRNPQAGIYRLLANGKSCTLEIVDESRSMTTLDLAPWPKSKTNVASRVATCIDSFWWVSGQDRVLQVTDGARYTLDELPDPFNIELVVVGSSVFKVRLERLRKLRGWRIRTFRGGPYAVVGRSGSTFLQKRLVDIYGEFRSYRLRAIALDSGNNVLDRLQVDFEIVRNPPPSPSPTPTPTSVDGEWTFVTDGGARRHEGGFVECAGKFWLIGGRGSRVTNIYDPADGTFSNGPTTNNLHHFQPVCVDNIIYIVGAMTGGFPSEPPANKVYYIDTQVPGVLSDGRFIPAQRRRGGNAAVVYNGCIWMVAGTTLGHVSGTNSWVDRWCLGPLPSRYGAWTANMPEPSRVRDHVSAAVLNDKLYVAGGRISDFTTDSGFDDEVAPIEWFDFVTEEWSIGADIPKPRAAAGVVAYMNSIIVIGGESSAQRDAHNDVTAYDPDTNTWRALSPLLQERHATTAFVFKNKIWIMGGSGNRGGSPELTSLEYFSFSA